MTSSENSLKNYKHSLFIFPSILVFLIVYHPSLPVSLGTATYFRTSPVGARKRVLSLLLPHPSHLPIPRKALIRENRIWNTLRYVCFSSSSFWRISNNVEFIVFQSLARTSFSPHTPPPPPPSTPESNYRVRNIVGQRGAAWTATTHSQPPGQKQIEGESGGGGKLFVQTTTEMMV